jgi:hypothetical protein
VPAKSSKPVRPPRTTSKVSPDEASIIIRAFDALPDEALCDERAVSAKSTLARKTVQRYRLTGGGPDFVKVGGHAVRYRVGTVRDWLCSLTSAPFSHTAAMRASRAPTKVRAR